MSMDDVIERLSSDKEERNKWVGVYIGVLAVLLAICGVGGANATKDATRANIEASNTWAFFQAKNIRRNTTNLAADQLDLFLAALPDMPAPARKAFDAERDIALRKDPYFDWSQAFLQIAIVLASVYLIIGNLSLLGLSAGFSALGLLLMLNGHALLVALPFLG